jgi:hypothetical protein
MEVEALRPIQCKGHIFIRSLWDQVGEENHSIGVLRFFYILGMFSESWRGFWGSERFWKNWVGLKLEFQLLMTAYGGWSTSFGLAQRSHFYSKGWLCFLKHLIRRGKKKPLCWATFFYAIWALIEKLKRGLRESWRGFGVHRIPGKLSWIEVWGWVVEEASVLEFEALHLIYLVQRSHSYWRVAWGFRVSGLSDHSIRALNNKTEEVFNTVLKRFWGSQHSWNFEVDWSLRVGCSRSFI